MKLFSTVGIFFIISLANPLLAQSYDAQVIRAELYSASIQRTGKLDFKRKLSLSFKSGGYLSLLNVDEGQRFTKGQMLASLDITELKEDKNSRYAQLTQAKREVERIGRLMGKKMASERDMDVATAQVKTLQAAYQVSDYNLNKAQIYAPFSGVVLARNTELGEFQSPGAEVLKVAKLEWIVKVALTGEEVSQVKLQQKVNVNLSHIGTVSGIISKVPAIATNGSSLFTIEILLPEIKSTAVMVAGQLASIAIAIESEKFVYRLPIAALVSVDDLGQAVVMVQPDESSALTQRSFEIFKIDNEYVYLNASPNDPALIIVTQGWQNYLVDGQ
ncbi:MAG: efflux RND transporter periplasmic adaptor subunit [Cognaticolwellia sp.]